jgi:2-polyprenyl-3-methyl-5-hydroxy-6-metoxy-1,4-benzoquinol methylase
MNCRFCDRSLRNEFADLGNSPPSNAYLSKAQLLQPEVYYPLKLYVCENCFLVQVDEYKKADEIFSQDYAYYSSFSKSWLKHSKAYVEMMTERFGYDTNSQIIEIASNDGYLLQYFKEKNIPVLGIEPTKGTADAALAIGIDSWVKFFGVELAKEIVTKGKQADLLLGNNVLAHVPDINDFVGGLKIALKERGVITMEFPHLMQLVKYNQFDTIYHEHFSYLSLISVQQIFLKHGLTIFDVEEVTTHGGSLRIFARHSEDEATVITDSVQILINEEIELGMNLLFYYKGFQQKVDIVKNNFLSFLVTAKLEGKKVAAYGAAAKGNTLLNYCGVKTGLIDFVADANPYKQNKFLPGSHIRIVSESLIQQEKPDYIVIFPWNIKEEITQQLDYIRNWGGKFVVAIPRMEIF